MSTANWVGSLFTSTYGNEGQLSRRFTHTILIFFAVALLQAAFQKYIFDCPSENWVRFSYLAFFAPAVPLFLTGWLSNKDFQDAIRGVCHGCWNRESRKRNRMRIRWRYMIKTVFTSHATAYVAPFCWFLMCLLNRRIMTCAVYGPVPEIGDAPVKKRYRVLETYSQLIGFDMLIIGACLMSIILTIKQCCTQANPGKEIVNFQCLDYYASFEADAARQYFEEVMRAAAEENGRRKVQMLLESQQSDVENLKGVDKAMKEMSYEHFSTVRNSLMEIYPKTDNSYDRKLQLYTLDAWQEEAEVFKKHLANNKSSVVDCINGDIEMSHARVNKDGEKARLLSASDANKTYTV